MDTSSPSPVSLSFGDFADDQRMQFIDSEIQNLTQCIMKNKNSESDFEEKLLRAKIKREEIKSFEAVAKSQLFLTKMKILAASKELLLDLQELKNNHEDFTSSQSSSSPSAPKRKVQESTKKDHEIKRKAIEKKKDVRSNTALKDLEKTRNKPKESENNHNHEKSKTNKRNKHDKIHDKTKDNEKVASRSKTSIDSSKKDNNRTEIRICHKDKEQEKAKEKPSKITHKEKVVLKRKRTSTEITEDNHVIDRKGSSQNDKVHEKTKEKAIRNKVKETVISKQDIACPGNSQGTARKEQDNINRTLTQATNSLDITDRFKQESITEIYNDVMRAKLVKREPDMESLFSAKTALICLKCGSVEVSHVCDYNSSDMEM